jgi:hypothetical protein
MLERLIQRFLRPKRNPPLSRDPGLEAHLAESVAYSAFLASGVNGVEKVSFQDFVAHLRASPEAHRAIAFRA